MRLEAIIARAVNSALATKKLLWNFTDTLTRNVGLGKMFDPIEALEIDVVWGKHRIGDEALTLVISFKLTFVRAD